MNEEHRSKGGVERAKKLSPAHRSEIASDAANTRWLGDEKEIRALKTIVKQIEGLNYEEKKRVCAYLKSRYSEFLI